MISVQSFLTDQKLHFPKNRRDKPQISVILPLPRGSWNNEFAMTIQSALDQSFTDFELVIVGDGCDQTVVHALTYLQENEPRILYAHHESWSELPALRINEGLRIAKGKYIAYLFSGIVWERDALMRLNNEIVKHPAPAVIYGRSLLGPQQLFGEPFFYGLLMKMNIVPNHAVLHHARIAEEIGGYDYHIASRSFCDWDFWMRCSQRYPFVHVAETISRVFVEKAGIEDAAGMDASRFICAIDRSKRLRLDRFHKYNVDDVHDLYRCLDRPLADDIYARAMLPWKLRHKSDPAESMPAVHRSSTNLLVTLRDRDATAEICFTNIQIASQDRIIAAHFYEEQVTLRAIQSVDAVVFLRILSPHSIPLLHMAIGQKRPVIYALDDDLLGLHELNELKAFPEWKVSSPVYDRIRYFIEHADIVVVYSPLVQEIVRAINPRAYQLRTNLLSKYVDKNKHSLHERDDPVRIGIMNTGSRSEELRFIWPAITRLSQEKGNSLHFVIWGAIPDGLPNLHSPASYMGKTFSYYEYLERLQNSDMDLLLVPLFDDIRLRKGKCPIKYLEATAAGAIGLYSNTQPYAAVIDGVTGIKVWNTVEDWYMVMKKWVETPYRIRKDMWSRAKEHILEQFTSESQLEQFDAMLEAAKFHCAMRAKRHDDGKPRIAFLVNPADRQFYDHAMVAERYGITPVWRMPESCRNDQAQMAAWIHQRGEELEYVADTLFHSAAECAGNESLIQAVADWLRDRKVSIIHSPAHHPIIEQAAKMAGIPYVAYKIEGLVTPLALFQLYNRFIY